MVLYSFDSLPKPSVLVCMLVLAWAPANGEPLSFYLPPDTAYDSRIPTPVATLGFEPGDRHIRHDELLTFLERLADQSERVQLRVIGHTYQDRPLVELVISSPDNLARLDYVQDRQASLQAGDLVSARSTQIPLLVSLNYGIHGNEPSSSNAVPLVAYYLAASKDPHVGSLLQDTIIVLNPSLNPDGLSFFASWVNNNRSRFPETNRFDREHNAPWPYGRVNHYLFDLNRDWLFLQQSEMRSIVAGFRRWLPQVMGDFHETGVDTTAYFQPGVPKRTHPLTLADNQALTKALAEHIAAGLNEHGLLYYTKERFDDFYHGKGATYADLVGSVGLTFEVGGSRGLVHESRNGVVRFADTIRKQIAMSLALIDGAWRLRERLQEYQLRYFESALAEADNDSARFVIIGDANDPARFRGFCEWLLRQGIVIHESAKSVQIQDREYEPGHAIVIPLRQPSYRMIQSLFERRRDFAEPIFYDISTWNAALAYDLPVQRVGNSRNLIGRRISLPLPPSATGALPVSSYGYLIRWTSSDAPAVVASLHSAGVQVRAAMKPLSVETHEGVQTFESGSIFVPVRLQDLEAGRLHEVVSQAISGKEIEAFSVDGGLAQRGIDLGSDNFRVIDPVRVALLAGSGVARSEVGEIWHLLDTRIGMALALINRDSLEDVDLREFTHLILVDGRYGALGEQAARIRRWVHGGGTLVLQRRATALAPAIVGAEGTMGAPELADGNKGPDEGATGELDASSIRAYGSRTADGRLAQIPGAIFQLRIDRTHPLFFGFDDDSLPVMRRGTYVLPFGTNRYAIPALYSETPVLAGYASEENIRRLKSTPAVHVVKIGRGRIVSLADNPNFRGFFQGSSRIFTNVVFFGQTIR